MDASPPAANAAGTEELHLGVLLFIPSRAMEDATMDGLARAGYTDLTVAQDRWKKLQFHALREHAGLVFQEQPA